MTDASATRRWYQRLPRSFSLRTMMWLTLVVGLIVMHYAQQRRLENRIERLESLLQVNRPTNSSWAPAQATGKPNSLGTGDQSTAWAPASMDTGKEWLEVSFATRHTPKSILIYEVCAIGSVYKVTAFDGWGREVVLWSGADPTKPGKGRAVSRIPVKANLKTNRIKIYTDTSKSSGWNEIDAVGSKDSAGKTHWATGAKASSSYGWNSYGVRARSGFMLDAF